MVKNHHSTFQDFLRALCVSVVKNLDGSHPTIPANALPAFISKRS